MTDLRSDTTAPTTTDDHAHLTPRLQAGEADLRVAAVGIVRAERASVRQGVVGAIVAGADASLSQGGARTMVAGGNLAVTQGGGAMLIVGGDADIHQGGAGTLVALGGARIERGGAMTVLASRVEAGEGTTIGLALSPRISMAPGARVMVSPSRAAIAGVVAGVVAGVIAAVVGRLTRRG